MKNNVVPKNIFIDMDGVLVDFEKGISELIGHPLGREVLRYGIPAPSGWDVR